MNAKQFLFIRDAVVFTFTAFGGPQAHMAIMLKDFVNRRHYINENELLELNALTQILPGPSSTQTLVGVAYKVGGLWLSVVTFLIWVLPSAAILCFAAIMFSFLGDKEKFVQIMRYVQPIAVGIVAYAAYRLGKTVLKTNISVWLAVTAVIVTLILRNAYVFPILILVGGIISSALETSQEENQLRVKLFSNINTQKVMYYIGILLLFATLGAIINQTSPFSLPIRMFENFYRNGIIIFGGGQVLIPLMFTEFVEMKRYLTGDEFLAGFAFQQALPGPTFSFTSFVGAMTMKHAGGSIGGQILGSVVATLGINLPGFILVLFFVPFWNDLKKISRIKNSLSGINAVAVGFLIAGFVFMLEPLSLSWLTAALVLTTFLLLTFTRIRTPFIILAGVLMGWFI
ncbi:chromate efflux transporter [Paradesertivirga mongoliensis]|uniref:Chromate efflux transporter n=1 Tax=Paradesertivirga mongoliensis TaxID=2100740 RepID=A0ABW4ZLI2_9SPHI|nr:chromate efflux transporter [Pedobacter mongoliensis]